MSTSAQIVPFDYETPSFPSLFPLTGPSTRIDAKYLFYTGDIWRFTLYWTMLFYIGAHLTVALIAVANQWRNWKIVWGAPVLYSVISGLHALMAGSVVGLM